MKSHQSKIAARKLIDEPGLQESNPRIDLPPATPSRHHDTRRGNPCRDPRCTQAVWAWSWSHTILDWWVVVITAAGTMVALPPEEKPSTKLIIIND
jgi:hypothetical protein